MRRLRLQAPGLRGRLLLSVLVSIGVVLAGLVLAFNLVLGHRLTTDATGILQAHTSAELASLRVSDGRIVLGEAPDERSPDAQIWVFQGSHALERPHSSVNDSAAAALARRAPAIEDVAGTDTRLYAVPVAQAGGRLGAVVAGLSLAPYHQTRRTALIASLILAVAVLLAVAVAARWLIDRALWPVAQMTRQASDWSEHDLDRRFARGPARDELTQLASTFDGLLERLASSLRHEQRLSAEISHELRTPLANIVAEAQYALRHAERTDESRAALEQVLQSARQLGRTLDTLMTAARAQVDSRHAASDARACAQAAVATIGGQASGLQLQVQAPERPVRVAVEAELVTRILAPLLENAARHARRSVGIVIEPQAGSIEFTVHDDGPGVPEEARESIFEPGHRGVATVATTAAPPGAGLGLALCRRLARTAGGEVRVQPSDAGARFSVRLPAA